MDKKKYFFLEDLLFKGFIPLKIKIGNINFVFKTLNEEEYSRISLMSGFEEDPKYKFNYYLNYLYLSLYMINGYNILYKREELYDTILEFFKNLPIALLHKLMKTLELLMKKANEQVTVVESYSYESESRYFWAFKKNQLNSQKNTGILGSDILGLNNFQKYWIFLNSIEDIKESFDTQYSLAKFMASSHNPKGVKKLENLDRLKREEEKKRRERIRLNGTPDEKRYISGPTETAEDLVKELDKQMRGEKDEHDRIIEEYEKTLRDEMVKQQTQLQQVRERYDKDTSELDSVAVISEEEMKKRIKKVREGKTFQLEASDIDEERSKKFTQIYTTDTEDKKEKEYVKQQKILAAEASIDNLDFPNLRK